MYLVLSVEKNRAEPPSRSFKSAGESHLIHRLQYSIYLNCGSDRDRSKVLEPVIERKTFLWTNGECFMVGESFHYCMTEKEMSSLVSLILITSYQVVSSLAESYHFTEECNIEGYRNVEGRNRGHNNDIQH